MINPLDELKLSVANESQESQEIHRLSEDIVKTFFPKKKTPKRAKIRRINKTG